MPAEIIVARGWRSRTPGGHLAQPRERLGRVPPSGATAITPPSHRSAAAGDRPRPPPARPRAVHAAPARVVVERHLHQAPDSLPALSGLPAERRDQPGRSTECTTSA